MSKVMQTIFIAPNFISLVVMVGILYLFFGTTGFVNNVLESLGLERYSFFLEAGAFRPLYTLSGVWQGFGWSAIIYIAALSGRGPDPARGGEDRRREPFQARFVRGFPRHLGYGIGPFDPRDRRAFGFGP